MGCNQSTAEPPLPEGADPNLFPAEHDRAPDAYTTFNSINWLLKRGDLGLVVGEFLFGKREYGGWSGGLDAPIPIRQHLPDGATFGGPLELDEDGKIAPYENKQQVFALSYTWNAPWPPDETIGVHPDPNQYYLTIVKKALRLYREYEKEKTVFVFWVRRSLSRAASLPPHSRRTARRTGCRAIRHTRAPSPRRARSRRSSRRRSTV